MVFTDMVEEFPRLNELHPFYKHLLMNSYNEDHYKVALGQMNTLKIQITKIGADYTKLLKHSESLFSCKRLKVAAFGRIAKMVMKQNKTSLFLEDVRQHLSRLPTIDPSIRTLMVAGSPNTGKSSFVDLVSRVKPEIQSYPFTTKQLFVGHFDYEYIRWQVIDSPGILDKPIEEISTIEHSSVIGLTHLDCAVLFFIDLSEYCGYTLQAQLNVLETVRPMFAKRPFAIACNKCDLMSLSKLAEEQPEKRALLEPYEKEGIPIFELSTQEQTGVQHLKNTMCAKMMKYSLNKKLASKKAENILNRVYVAKPPGGLKKQETYIPERVRKLHEQENYRDKITDSNPDVVLEKDIEEKEGLFYTTDYNKNKMLEKDEWKADKMPVFKDGKNIADLYVPIDVFEKNLEALKAEEAARVEAGFYESDPEDQYTEHEKAIIDFAEEIKNQVKVNDIAARLDRGKGVMTINRASRSRTRDRKTGDFIDKMESLGIDMEDAAPSSKFVRAKKRERSETEAPKEPKRDGSRAPSKRMRLEANEAKRARSRSKSVIRGTVGMPDPAQRKVVAERAKKSFKALQRRGRHVESFRSRMSQLCSAAEAAEMIVRVDDIIKNAPRQREGGM